MIFMWINMAVKSCQYHPCMTNEFTCPYIHMKYSFVTIKSPPISEVYAILTTSAITEEALKNAETAALFVRSDNHPAVKVYEKSVTKR